MLKTLYPISAALAVSLLSACGGSSGSGSGLNFSSTESRFVPSDNAGIISEDLRDEVQINRIDSDGNGFSIAAGFDTDERAFTAVSSLAANTPLDAMPTGGTVDYEGVYEVLYLDRESFEAESAAVRSTIGLMNMRANFDTGRFSGESVTMVSTRHAFEMSGDLANGTMTGEVTLLGPSTLTGRVSGPLQGRIDGDLAYGAFHGSTGEDSMAGGFVLGRQ